MPLKENIALFQKSVGCACGCAVSGRFLFSQTKLENFMIRSTVMVITSVIMGILSFPFRMWNLR